MTANYLEGAKSKLERREFKRRTYIIHHAIHEEFHNFDNDPVNASLMAEYNANLVAYTYKKNKTPREAQLPVITKFKGMEEKEWK